LVFYKLNGQFMVQGPEKKSGDPCATEVQPVIASPTLPIPFPFTNTVVDPIVMAAAWDGHGLPGTK
jgi:hypothetical protein